jgi:formylglycine-generating enzyme required for sulfatase activity
MVPFSVDGKSLCIDVYENSVGDTCVVPEPVSAQETSVNVNDADCVPQSKIGRMPWRFVSEVQAAQLCARAHKRLPTNIEWFTAAAGTPDGNGNCVLTGAIAVAGQKSSCISGIGALDMIGNVWEFVSGEVVDGKMLTDTVPGEGYVQAVRSDGLPNATGRDPVPMYNSDYFWSNASGTYAIMRGGFYSSGTDGGIYSAHAAVLQNFSSAAAGFRCVSELPR